MTTDHLRAESQSVQDEAGEFTTRAALLLGAADEIDRLMKVQVNAERVLGMLDVSASLLATKDGERALAELRLAIFDRGQAVADF